MNEQLKKYIDPIKNFWGKLSKKSKKIIFIVLGCVIAGSIVLSMVLNKPSYSVLYSGLNSDEATEVMTEIQKNGINCKDDNGTIYVPSDKENALRMQLSNEGHPKTAPNYDFFTKNVGNLTTDDERKIIEQYGLQDRLQSVIKTLDPIDTAYVTITIPKNEQYAWDDNKEKATASVTVKLKSGRSLNASQVSGIKNLVAKSVPNLSTDNVAVIDSSGEELNASGSAAAGGTEMDLSEFKLKIEKQYENNIENKIISLLAPTYGENNISASVKSQMDLDKKVQDIITYKPTTSDGKGIISKSNETHEETKDASSGGGVAGTQSNSDTTTTYPGVTVNGNIITTKDNKSYEYLVSKVQEQIQSNAAALDDLTVSVIINTPAMTAQAKTDLTDAIANAAGVSPSKVVVLNSTFATSAKPAAAAPQKSPVPLKYLIIGGSALLLLLIIIGILIGVNKRKKRAQMLEASLSPEMDEVPENPQEVKKAEVPTESIEEIRNHSNEKEEHVKKDLQEFSSKNPEIAAQLIRNWLRGDDDNGK